jgi:hypothetical protein
MAFKLFMIEIFREKLRSKIYKSKSKLLSLEQKPEFTANEKIFFSR